MDLINQTIEELKEKLLNRITSESNLDSYLLAKGMGQEFVDAVKFEMHRTPGFSFMNGNVTYRGESFIEPMLPNQPH